MRSTAIIPFALLPTLLFSQSDSTETRIFQRPVEITATRLTNTALNAPLAVTVLDKPRLQTATQQLSPYEVLGAVPGLFALNPDNFTQDLRISIRGFGARAAFGIRGIRVFTDGIPEGTPDGQVDVDNLDMGVVSRMEVLRGAASGLYGNASGGVIYFKTEEPVSARPLFEAQVLQGSYGFQRYQVKTGQKLGHFLYFLNGSYNKTVGYRNWSALENTLLNGKFVWQPQPGTRLALLANYGNSPYARDPGGLTSQQAADNPRQAGASNLLFQTGEAVAQARAGLTFEHKFSAKHSVEARAFQTWRELQNRLAIAANGYGDLHRQYRGAGAGYQFADKFGRMAYRLKSGIDIENQADTRKRYAYIKQTNGSETTYLKGDNVLHQLERFSSAGVYLLQDLQPDEKWLVSAGIRYDDLKLRVNDHFLSDGDQSGSRHFTKINPTAGVHFGWNDHAAVYANFSTTFESPALNELSNNPDGLGGFNPNLQPQTARSYEIGTKGLVPFKRSGESLQFDFATYLIETQNDITPYQIDGQPGKTYYRNAGKTERKGVELGLKWQLFAPLKAYFTTTFADYRYKNFSAGGKVYDGKMLPGIPRWNTQLELRYTPAKGFFAIAQIRNLQKVPANDDNSAYAPAYSIVNLRAGNSFRLKGCRLEPFLALNNLTNARYMANVQLNAAGDRFFEPGSERYWYGGVKFTMGE